jgi:predicted dehydrogenase
MAGIYSAIILGAGNVAGGYDKPGDALVLTHAHAYLSHSGFNLKGFYDTDLSVCKQMAQKWGVSAFEKMDDIGSVDVVSICTPDACHLTSLQQALALKPKVIFLEKPLANNQADAKCIVQLSATTAICVNYTRRFVPEFRQLADDISRNAFGSFLAGTGYYGKGTIHNGSHLIDLVRMLLGDITASQITASITDFYADDPTKSLVLDMACGGSVFLHGVDCRHLVMFELDLLFQHARIRILDSGERIEFYANAVSEKYPDEKMLQLIKTENTSIDQAIAIAVDEIYQHLQHGVPFVSTVPQAMEAIHFG